MKTLFTVAAVSLFTLQNAHAVTPGEAARIAKDYSLQFSDSLKVSPSELGTLVHWTSNPQDAYRIYVQNGDRNNDYHCEFRVVVDARTGEIRTGADSFNPSRKWSCEFLNDNGGGM